MIYFNYENFNIIAQDFVDSIDSRIQKTSNGHLLQLAYALTPVGRNSIRKGLKEGTYIKDNIEFDIAVNLKFDTKYVKNFLQKIDSQWFKLNNTEEEEEEREEEEEGEEDDERMKVIMNHNSKHLLDFFFCVVKKSVNCDMKNEKSLDQI